MSSWETSDRKSRLPSNWTALRNLVLNRCGGRCEVIKSNGKRCWDKATDVDHIKRGDNHDPSNLQGICTWHHRRKTARESAEIRAEMNAILTRPPEKHPGLINAPGVKPPNKGF